MEIDLIVSDIDKMQLVFTSDEPLAEKDYKELKLDSTVIVKSFEKYDPEFWSEYSIIQPNEALKSFDVSGQLKSLPE